MNSLLERYHTLDRLLGGDHAFISVDSYFPGVTLPDHLREQASVVLQLSRLFVGGMTLDEEKVTANLKFAGQYYECIVPLAAVWGMHSPDGQEQYYWPEEMSDSLMRYLVNQMFGGKRPDIKLQEGDTPELAPEPAKEVPSKGKKNQKRSHLSVVK
jgi:stringent starvation protein B